MLHTVEDPATLKQAIQVLVQLLLELQSEQYVYYILDEIHTQLCDQSSVRGFLPTFTFLGKLVDAVPSLPQSLASSHVPLLERLCSTLLYPDEGLKASVFYVWQRVWGAAGAAQSLPSPLRDRVCLLLLQTLAHACSTQLTINCLGFLKQHLKLGEVVSVLMNSPCEQIRSDVDQSLGQDREDQSSTQLSLERCPLPLILKKLLLSGDETLQVASAQCMAAILVHSPSQYCASFIQADVPEFLFERLSSGSECHSVYGIESLVRSLKEALRLTNVEVQRQGLLLLTEILERQPVGVRLFPSGPGFVAVAEAVLSGVSSHGATALLRVNHQSSPVQYKELEKLVEAIIARCTELPLPASSRCRVSLKGAEPSSQASRAGGFLLQALVCFHAACRLVEQCSSEPGLKENVFTAPSKQVQGQDPLESLCLLHCCDTVCIPTVTRHCEHAPSAQVLQHFFSILSYQFSLLPSLRPLFAAKLASSGFFRLALEHKAVLCAGNRNPALNAACCGFLQRLSVCLLSQPDPATSILPQDCEEIEAVFRSSLPSLCCRVCEWPSLLCESPGSQCDPAGPRATQYCLLTLLHLALQHGDRLLPDSTVFSCVVTLLCSVQVSIIPQDLSAVGSLPLVLRLLCLMQTSGSTENEMDGIHFKLLYHVSNLTGKLKASNTECLLPAFSYLYCCLRLSPPHCTDRAVSMLLCNTGLMDQLQATLNLSFSSSLAPSLSPTSALLCCSRLLLSSLITLQHTRSAKVHRSIRLNLGSTVQALVFGKRKTGSLLLASSLRLLQAFLDVDLESPVLCVIVGPGVGQRPLGDTDSSLYPLGSYGAHCLITALYGLLLQKQELLLSVSVNCLGSLLGFLHRRSPSTAQHVVCQPWSRFLLYSLLNSGESCVLHPATLTLLTLLLRYGSRVVVWEPDLCQVLEAVEKRGLKELGENTTQALRQLLTQLHCSIFHPPPTEESRLRANTLMESLNSLPPTANDNLPISILRVGEMSVCLSDFTVKTDGHIGSQL
ncbi:hypothetical protein J4Q44_G00174620 [Coregonus suidteri]|uniref:Meiosis inhibitor protein 1 n=1 Tax=Coregonus suidteri TaxID=861788 RepID=A0AAN8LJ55_9TELE